LAIEFRRYLFHEGLAHTATAETFKATDYAVFDASENLKLTLLTLEHPRKGYKKFLRQQLQQYLEATKSDDDDDEQVVQRKRVKR